MDFSDMKITEDLVKSISESKNFDSWCYGKSCRHTENGPPCPFGSTEEKGVYLKDASRCTSNFCEPLYNKIKSGEIKMEKEKEKEFEFQVGDIVTVPWSSKEHVVSITVCGYNYPLSVDGASFTKQGRYRAEHELPALKLVRRPKKEMTFERIKSEGILKLVDEDGGIKHVIGFSPSGSKVVTVLICGDDEWAASWKENEIKDWEEVVE